MTVSNPVQALLVDLDDTLYPQAEFLAAAWREVVAFGSSHGIDRDEFATALDTVCAQGSANGGIIDRALESIGRNDIDAQPFVAVFTGFHPTRLNPYDGVAATLASLAHRYPLALVTDGNPDQQRAKLTATGLSNYFDVVVCSDDFGREHRKPDPQPFLAALAALGTTATEAVMIGDSPHKDIAGAEALGMRSIRVRTGEYSARPDHASWSVASFTDVESVLATTPPRVRCVGAR